MTETTEENITISKKKYESLLRDQRKLSALEAGGVDNWEGYSECLGYEDEDEEEEEDGEDY